MSLMINIWCKWICWN